MRSSSIERGAPERASSCSPSIRRATNRLGLNSEPEQHDYRKGG
jgi:hypothetical protein